MKIPQIATMALAISTLTLLLARNFSWQPWRPKSELDPAKQPQMDKSTPTDHQKAKSGQNRSTLNPPSGKGQSQHSSILYWIEGQIRFTQYTKEGSTLDVKQTAERNEDIFEKLKRTETLKEDIRIGIKAKVETDAGASTAGVSAGASASSSAECSFSIEKCREDVLTAESKRSRQIREEAQKATTYTTGDWKLLISVKFKNVSDQEFSYRENSNVTGMQLTIKAPEQQKRHYVCVKSNELTPDNFDLPGNGGEVSLSYESTITDNTIKQILYESAKKGELDKCVRIVFDSQFPLTNKATGAKWDYKDVRVCNIAPVESSPIQVDYREKKLREVLTEASKQLPPESQFKMTDEGLEQFGGSPLGKYSRDGRGVYIILAKWHGKIQACLSKADLEKKLSPEYGDNDLEFVRVGLEEIYIHRKEYPASVASNGLTYATANIGELNDNDLIVCAMMAKDKRDYRLFGKCLCSMRNPLNYLKGEGDRTMAMSLVIKTDDVKMFKKLKILGWAASDRTIFGHAAECGSINIVKWLLEGCAENERPNVDELVPGIEKDAVGDSGKTPLFWAAKNGHLEVCQYLVSKGADFERTFHEDDKSSGEVKEFDELIDASYVDDARIRKYIEAEREVKKIRDRGFRWAGKDPTDATVEKINEWIDAGVSPNRYIGGHWSLFSWAIELRDCGLVGRMVDKGADINGKYSATPTEGWTALKLASTAGDAPLLAKLSKKRDMMSGKDLCLLGFCYHTGVGLEKDDAKAFECMSLSAKKGYRTAHYNLSQFYDNGIGVPKNTAKAQEHKEEYEK